MNKRIECIKRLLFLAHSYEDMCEWFVEQKFLEASFLEALTRDQERAEVILEELLKLERDNKLILLDFFWTVLPLEQIKIIVVTHKEMKEFTFGY